MRLLHRSKVILIFDFANHVLGCSLIIHSSDIYIIFSQIIQFFGGGFALQVEWASSHVASLAEDIYVFREQVAKLQQEISKK
ncbi:hypothetical protein D9619_005117 [Psilocybe cf. subviscida]|uniref:Uncharacterized protein n=1 Tax=Psilocybe cf. subviscida TaxID=2480587 RepID=A0A8H5BQL6_9AGAR|nr:hypothetical protein D9619_005117 [Psilocybe cf. subviscida]